MESMHTTEAQNGFLCEMKANPSANNVCFGAADHNNLKGVRLVLRCLGHVASVPS